MRIVQSKLFKKREVGQLESIFVRNTQSTQKMQNDWNGVVPSLFTGLISHHPFPKLCSVQSKGKSDHPAQDDLGQTKVIKN